MEVKRRTQAERSAATRALLVDAARKLWAARGYAEVGTPEIAKAAGVTRGAMYHQFADKAALFREVVAVVEQDVLGQLGARIAAEDPGEALRGVIDAWLDVSQQAEVRQLLLLDAPVVLGWAGYRDLAVQYSLGVTEQMLRAAADAGELRVEPTRALAHILIGAMDEASMVVATADDAETARAQARDALRALLDGILR